MRGDVFLDIVPLIWEEVAVCFFFRIYSFQLWMLYSGMISSIVAMAKKVDIQKASPQMMAAACNADR